MSFDSLLIHTCDIGALDQGAKDDYGRPAKTWPASYTEEPCRLISTDVREVKFGAEVVISDWKLFVDNSVIIDEQDQVSNIKNAKTGTVIDAATFEVVKVQPMSDHISQHHKEILLRKVT